MNQTRVKICCIADEAEAFLAIRAGAAALGLVSAMPSGPGVIDESEIATIAPRTPPGIGSFLLTSRTDAASIIAQQKRCRVNTIQLCDRIETAEFGEMRRHLPGIALVQVIHVRDELSIDEARLAAIHADALLLDSGNPGAAVKELGGTGRVHDWTISRRIRETVDIPLFLAGGLSPANVAQAIRQVKPFGVDICSGVRTNGRLDPLKLKAFMQAVRETPV